MHELPDISTYTPDQKDDLIRRLFEQVKELAEQVAELKALQGKDSHNSSKPPSSDGLAKKKKTKSLRKASGKKVGGQIGHKGTTLKQVSQATRIVRHPLPTQCERCNESLPLDEACVSEIRQVFDIPAPSYEVTEHQTLKLAC